MNDSSDRRRQNSGPPASPDPFLGKIDAVLADDIKEELRFRKDFFLYAFKALDFNGIDGDYAEFGCFGGTTFCMAYDQIRRRRAERHMWAFDSFRGLPPSSNPLDRHPAWLAGTMAYSIEGFHAKCAGAGIAREQYTVAEGYFEQTLAPLPPEAPPNNIALAYIDCDMYSSTRTVLEFLLPRLKHGMLIAFDDYFCWSATARAGERQAQLDVLEGNRKWRLLRYRDFGWAGRSFLVESAGEN